MKINESHFGKKMRRTDWDDDDWFIPLGFSLDEKLIIGESFVGGSDHWKVFGDWVPFEEPKKKVIKRMAPALWRRDDLECYVSSIIFTSEEEARKNFGDSLIKWPASESMFCEIEVEE